MSMLTLPAHDSDSKHTSHRFQLPSVTGGESTSPQTFSPSSAPFLSLFIASFFHDKGNQHAMILTA